MKTLPYKILYGKNRRKGRNLWLFDAGLHTLHMKPKDGEWDMDFVTRFLIKFLEGCRRRGGKQYKDYLIQHCPGDNYIAVWARK